METLSTHMNHFLKRKIFYFDNKAEAIQSGFKAFDENFSGFYRGELTFIAARPGNGLYLVLNNLAINQSVNALKKVLYFTTDFSGPELSRIIIEQLSGKRLTRRWEEYFGKAEKKHFKSLPATLADCPFFIEDQCFNIQSVIRKAWQVNAIHGLDLILIDDLTAISKTEQGEPFRERRTVEMLNDLAQNLNVPLVIGVNLTKSKFIRNKDDDSVSQPDPGELNDISIMNYAGKLILLHIPDYYLRGGVQPDHTCQVFVSERTTNRTATLYFKFDYVKGLLNELVQSGPGLSI
ncbi:DnaB-like helicase C-terminal domain-containing protein [Lentimicrobium sp.]|uniref:DnaB-like helicase C-terminal domain-containing protein n=1 Tax=Lentimicrobium sp. TaxID=2034841 RepID=UPI002CF25BDB|nr:DnaB-like helicase C-terminal domain-containing protein [Lentimicrobium sp.]HPR27009.1 DnaB-like helicase C-terminal domain-containing protein [Lentimicrobium sp.]